MGNASQASTRRKSQAKGAIEVVAGYRAMTVDTPLSGNYVYVLFTALGMHSIHKLRHLADETGRTVSRKINVEWFVEKWELNGD